MKTERVLKKNALKAYKAFNSDLTCIGFQYEVGKTYRHNEALRLCEAGFHACERLVDCFTYYEPNRAKLEFVRFWLGVISREILKTPSYVHPESIL